MRKESKEQIDMFSDKSGNCKFCKIIRGEIQSYVVFEDNMSFAFLDHRPLIPGHCLLVPKEHYRTLIDLPTALIAPLFINSKLLAQAAELGLEAEGSFVAINNRVSQSAPHLHIHIVPRRRKDGLKGFFWPRQSYKDEDAKLKVQEAIRSAISKIQSM
ncbi:MAG TPA: HIT family protein [Thermodesulfobacteriota bacterium]|nr:HIT family protein [Thermodesulfobacteriota bacterium]